MSKNLPIQKNRHESLDHLRGFFILAIIVDHLSRFPSVFAILSGKALLWVTAAEGFVSISGLLVGYVRGYRNRTQPFKEVAFKLLKRAALLYAWSIIASIVFVWIIWNVPLKGGFPSTPMAPNDWGTFLPALFTMHYTYVWVHFLTLYALFLAFSPIAVWLFRQNRAWLVGVISFLVLVAGWMTKSEALQWQFLFFIPSIFGFYLENIMAWWKRLDRKKRIGISAGIIGLTTLSIAASVVCTFFGFVAPSVSHFVNDVLYAKDSVSLLRAGTAFVWFTGYLLVFYFFRAFIQKYLNWLLMPLGMRSLSAYILHGAALCIISYFTIGDNNFWTNSFMGAVAIMIVWALLKTPFVRRIIPA